MLRYKLLDMITGKTTLELYRKYQETQWMTRREIEEFKVRKLRKLLKHCYQNIPMYYKIMLDYGIKWWEVGSTEDIRLFPVIDKSFVKKYAKEERLCRSLIHQSTQGRTGGTTVEPLELCWDKGCRSSVWAAFYRFRDWMGVGLEDYFLSIWGAPVVRQGIIRKLKRQAKMKFSRELTINAFKINMQNVERVLNKVHRYRPSWIRGYASVVYEFARLIETKKGENLDFKAVTTTAEPLFEIYRKQFYQTFGAPTFDQYSCGEIQSVAFECGEHTGLHVAEERVICEIENPDDHNRGPIILTDLDNFVMPMIRYKPGDIGEKKTDACPCGRETMMLTHILGRSADVLETSDGTKIHPEYFTHLLNETGTYTQLNIKKYQVIQDAKDHLQWKIVGDQLTSTCKRKLQQEIGRTFGVRTKIDIKNVDEIGRSSSGKFRYVICLLRH